jgi:hypothetical protein
MVRILPKQFSRPQPPASQGSTPQLLQPRHHPPVQPNFICRSSLVTFGHLWSSLVISRKPSSATTRGQPGLAGQSGHVNAPVDWQLRAGAPKLRQRRNIILSNREREYDDWEHYEVRAPPPHRPAAGAAGRTARRRTMMREKA